MMASHVMFQPPNLIDEEGSSPAFLFLLRRYFFAALRRRIPCRSENDLTCTLQNFAEDTMVVEVVMIMGMQTATNECRLRELAHST
jgi:hypothetical protein